MNLEISRVGKPRLVSDLSSESVKVQNEYKITTTPLPAGARGYNWFMIFNGQLQGPLVALHDRNQTITVYCDSREYPNWLEQVDAAIKQANEQEGTFEYEGHV